jgi:hypothetical protein
MNTKKLNFQAILISLKLLHCAELLWRGSCDLLGQPVGSDLRHGVSDERPVRGRVQLGRGRGGPHQHRRPAAVRHRGVQDDARAAGAGAGTGAPKRPRPQARHAGLRPRLALLRHLPRQARILRHHHLREEQLPRRSQVNNNNLKF